MLITYNNIKFIKEYLSTYFFTFQFHVVTFPKFQKKRIIFSILALLLLTTNLFANPEVDSLVILLGKSKSESQRFEIYITLSQIFSENSNFAVALNYGSKALNISENGSTENKALATENLGKIYQLKNDNYNAIYYFQQAIIHYNLLEKHNKSADCKNKLARIYLNTGYYEKALMYNYNALESLELENNIALRANILKDIGMIYQQRNNYEKALKYYENSYKIFLVLKNEIEIAKILINKGITYTSLANYEVALQCFDEAKELLANHQQPVLTAFCILKTGVVEGLQKKYKEAIQNHRIAIEICKKENYALGLAIACTSIADIYLNCDSLDKAEENYLLALRYAEETQSRNELKDIYLGISHVYEKKQDFSKALYYIKLNILIKDSIFQINNRENISEYEIKYEEQQAKVKEYREKIIRYILLGIIIFSTILLIIIHIAYQIKVKANKEMMVQQQIIRLKNETLEKQQIEIKQQAILLEKNNQELQKLSVVASKTDNAVCIINKDGKVEWVNDGFVKQLGYTLQEFQNFTTENGTILEINSHIPIAIEKCKELKRTFFYTNCNRKKNGEKVWMQTALTPIFNNQNEIIKFIAIDSDVTEITLAKSKIEKQNEEITKQHNQILKQQHELTSSIKYARLIQASLFPLPIFVNALFPKNFILNKPRDIVSGDFYWMTFKNGKRIVAVADSTGHGVPGAFMSMLGIALLKETVNYVEIIEANEILNNLRMKVIKTLHQTGKNDALKDGMDIAVCVLDYRNMKIQYAGANIPLYFFPAKNFGNENPLQVIKADSMPVSIHEKDTVSFTNNEFDIEYGDIIYIATDGYKDQFGGADDKKFLGKRLKQLLTDIYQLDFKQQKNILEENLLIWQGKNQQVDDILMLGIQIGQ